MEGRRGRKNIHAVDMSLIPTYSPNVGAPDLAGAYLGRQRIQQQAASDAARISLGYAQLQQEAVANEMQLAATKEAQSRTALKAAQEAEIQKAYNETQLGIQQRNLQLQEQKNQQDILKAAQEFDRMQGYQRRVNELSKTIPLEEAARQAILETGGTGLSTALERPAEPSPVPALNFQLKQLEDAEQSIMSRYPSLSSRRLKPEDEAAIEGIRKSRSQLQIPQDLIQKTQTGTNTTPKMLRVVRDSNGKLVIQK